MAGYYKPEEKRDNCEISKNFGFSINFMLPFKRKLLSQSRDLASILDRGFLLISRFVSALKEFVKMISPAAGGTD